MTPARPYGPSRPHREPARPERVQLADLVALYDPANTYASALALLRHASPDVQDAAWDILNSAASAGVPRCDDIARKVASGNYAIAIAELTDALAAVEDNAP